MRNHLPARAPQLSFLTALLFPGGVIRPRRVSYAAKLIPTYGATPIAVATRPRYNALTPPSSRMTFRVIPHIVSSEGKWRAEVCSAEASLGCEDEGVGADVDAAVLFEASIDAVAIDNRERTKSNGYVVPAKSEIKTPDHAADWRAGRTDRSNASQCAASQPCGGI
jgi:hypothetical protein